MSDGSNPVRVIKLGGSLLDFERLPVVFSQWLHRQSRRCNVVLVGGGPFVESVRTAQRRFSLADVDCHELCIDLLDCTARLGAIVLRRSGGCQLLENWRRLQDYVVEGDLSAIAVLKPVEFLRDVEPQVPGPRMPADWNATSDSIAARLAVALSAAELVLLKSSQPPGESLDDLARIGYVDRFFPTAAATIPRVRLVNLRQPIPPRPHFLGDSQAPSLTEG